MEKKNPSTAPPLYDLRRQVAGLQAQIDVQKRSVTDRAELDELKRQIVDLKRKLMDVS